MNELTMNRRQFARRAMIAPAVAAGYQGTLGANDRLSTAIMGCGPRGTNTLLK